MAESSNQDARNPDDVKRQTLLAAALDVFPTKPLHPRGERSQRYHNLVAGRPVEQQEVAAIQGMLTSRINYATRRWRRHVDEQLRRRGQSLIRWHALFEIAVNQPGETLTSIAARIGVMSATLVGLLDELEAEGLIENTVDENDRRSKLIALTPAGEEAVKTIYEFTADLRWEFLQGVSKSELLIMLDALDIMTTNIDKMTGSE